MTSSSRISRHLDSTSTSESKAFNFGIELEVIRKPFNMPTLSKDELNIVRKQFLIKCKDIIKKKKYGKYFTLTINSIVDTLPDNFFVAYKLNLLQTNFSFPSFPEIWVLDAEFLKTLFSSNNIFKLLMDTTLKRDLILHAIHHVFKTWSRYVFSDSTYSYMKETYRYQSSDVRKKYLICFNNLQYGRIIFSCEELFYKFYEVVERGDSVLKFFQDLNEINKAILTVTPEKKIKLSKVTSFASSWQFTARNPLVLGETLENKPIIKAIC